MKTFIPLILTLICISCTEENIAVKEKAIDNLSTLKNIKYTYNKLIIEGSTKDDTTFIETFSSASFIKHLEDTIIGYKYFIQDSLIHPHFGIPIKTSYHFDGDLFYTGILCSIENSLKKETFKELNQNVFQNVMRGQLPSILSILHNTDTQFSEDSIVENEKCIQLYLVKDDKPHYLFISKKTYCPVLLRIVTNLFQPFIEEYYYEDFGFLSEFNIPDYQTEIENYSPPKLNKVLRSGNELPNWIVNDLSGNTVSISESNHIKIIYLSMINCSPCQKAIPYVEKIHKTFQDVVGVDFFILYPYDSKEKLQKYVRTKGIETPILYNSYADDQRRLEMISCLRMGYPSVIIVDGNNQIKHIITGFTTSLSNRIQKLVKQMSDNEEIGS